MFKDGESRGITTKARSPQGLTPGSFCPWLLFASYVSLYIDLCNCLILICSIQHQMKVNLWTKNS
ncbi:hypothetical protein EYV18_10800, partial [Escherichia coli]